MQRVALALLVDFDGTILDTESCVLAAWREEYEYHGLELDEEAWLAALGSHQDRFAVFGSLVGSDYDEAASRARKQQRQDELVAALTLRDGVEDCLRKARSTGMRLGVVSSSSASWVTSHLERLGLLRLFEVVVTREDAERSKPFPDLYVTALSRLGVPPHSVVAIEDSANGVAAAKSAGIRCVAFPNAVTARQDLRHADALAESRLWEHVRALIDS
jgi:HAD superfamily hydrolase (TIGR01509 family)